MARSNFFIRLAEKLNTQLPEGKKVGLRLSLYPSLRWEFFTPDFTIPTLTAVVGESSTDESGVILDEFSKLIHKDLSYGKLGPFEGLIYEESDNYKSIINHVCVSLRDGDKLSVSFDIYKVLNDDVNLIHLIGKSLIENMPDIEVPDEIYIDSYKSQVEAMYTSKDKLFVEKRVAIPISKFPNIIRDIVENFNVTFNEDVIVNKKSIQCKDPLKTEYDAFINRDSVTIFYHHLYEDK